MSFATPWLLFLLPAAGAVFALRWLAAGRSPALAAASLGPAARAARTGTRLRARLRWLPTALRVAAVALLIVALARPQRGLAVTLLPEEGIDVVLALDVSGSMNERTSAGVLGPSKLEAAQEVIRDFVEGLEGDRVGLVTFRSTALLMSPLTLDHVALQRSVENVTPGVIADGTAIGLGLAQAVTLLEDSPARSQVVVLLTDGANNAGEVAPLAAAEIAEALGVRVYTVGFHGAAGAAGDVDVRVLQRIASTTGGAYYDASTQEDLGAAYESIGSLERSRVGERRFTSFQEFAPWLAGIALALLVADAVLRATVFRRYP